MQVTKKIGHKKEKTQKNEVIYQFADWSICQFVDMPIGQLLISLWTHWFIGSLSN